MDLYLTGKNVLITGGSKGIGKGIALAFLKEGANVGIIARDKNGLASLKEEEPDVEVIQADLLKQKERESSFKEFTDKVGKIDILINNVGGSNGTTTMETSMEEFQSAMELNYFSAVHFSKMAVTAMKATQSGSIINISSIFGRESGGKPTYNSAKAAMISFTKSLADEVIQEGIRVNGVAPGSILHPTANWQRKLEENPENIKKFVQEQIPGGRFGTVEEIADVVVFLASERAKWVVGATINVDGGQSRSNF